MLDQPSLGSFPGAHRSQGWEVLPVAGALKLVMKSLGMEF